MAAHPDRGRIYRRCGCRDDSGRQFGARCPGLNRSTRHGHWAYAFDAASAGGRRQQRCRSGFRRHYPDSAPTPEDILQEIPWPTSR